MPDAPLITITDPRDPREPSDLLEAGDEKSPFRLPRKVIAGVTVVALATAGTAIGIDRYRTHQQELRVKAAAFAKADTMHVHLSIAPGDEITPGAEPAVFVVDPATGTEVDAPPQAVDTGSFEVPVTLTDGPDALDPIQDVRLVGTGLTPVFDGTGLEQRFPGGDPVKVIARSTFPCSAVAAGRYPSYSKVEVVVAAASGREHTVTLPVASSKTGRAMALMSCRLPDPDAVPRMTMQEQHGRFLFDLSSIENSRDTLHVVSITSPGLALSVAPGALGPSDDIPPNASAIFDVTVRVTDCAAAKAGGYAIQAVVRGGAKTYHLTVVDEAPTAYSRTGSSLLRAKVAKACP